MKKNKGIAIVFGLFSVSAFYLYAQADLEHSKEVKIDNAVFALKGGIKEHLKRDRLLRPKIYKLGYMQGILDVVEGTINVEGRIRETFKQDEAKAKSTAAEKSTARAASVKRN